MSFLRHVLCKFGHLIESFRLRRPETDQCLLNYIETIQYPSEIRRYPLANLDAADIIKYCQPNLKRLQLWSTIIDCESMEPLFGRLTSLCLTNIKFIGNVNKLFGNCSQLEELILTFTSKLRDNRFRNSIVHKFPNLKKNSTAAVPFKYFLRVFVIKSTTKAYHS